MARKKLIAGNWKMNCLVEEGTNLAKQIATDVKSMGKLGNIEFLICPTFTALTNVKKALRGAKVALGAQDCHYNNSGAHTGDISPAMLKDVGCSYVILGHSERRADHFESNELINQKAIAAYEQGLKAVICIGETLQQREDNQEVEVCKAQILGSVPDNATDKNTVIAYEPVWAIGTGKTPTAEQVQAIHLEIRKILTKKLGKSIANRMQILYGGSVKPSNAKEFLGLPDVDGALIGGASLKAEDFMSIAKNVKE
ncbi:MAG: triose-phosphate isomerase [Alphaproteobacteria bacterium]